MEVILTIDIGTSSVKVAIIDAGGKLIKISQVKYPTFYMNNNNVEQNPEDWWHAVKSGIYQISNEIQNRRTSRYSIIGIACCGHSPTLVCVDRQGKILRPAITWQDSRAFQEANFIKKILNKEYYKSILASPLTPNSRIAKLLWLKNNEPDIMNNVNALLEPKDYINFKLTGKFNTSLLSGRGFLDIKTGRIYSKFLNLLEIDESIIPKAVSSHSIIGNTTKSITEETGLPEGIPVIAGEMDSITSIIGTGISQKNMCYNISGTSEIIGISTDQLMNLSKINKFPCFAYPIYNHLQILFGATQASGKSIEWYIKNILNKDIYKTLAHDKKRDFCPKEPLLFLPYIEGERSPIWDTNARGMFFGLSNEHSKVDLYRAILEGIAFSVLHNFEILLSLPFQKVFLFDVLRISGGGVKNNNLTQIKSDILGKKIITTKVCESGLLGGAILAMIGLKIYQFDEAIENMVQDDRIFYPNREKHYKYYSKLYDIYKNLYLSNQKLFQELCKIKKQF